MKKFMLFVLCIFILCGCVTTSELYVPQNKIMYAHTNLKFSRHGIRWHNTYKHTHFIPVGSEVEVSKIKDRRVFFKFNNEKFVLKIRTSTLDKYLVANLRDVGLDKIIDKKVKEKILRCRVAVDMTKEEVFLSLGCPLFVDGIDIPTRDLALLDLMNSDTWYYIVSGRSHQVLKFKDSILVEISNLTNFQKDINVFVPIITN